MSSSPEIRSILATDCGSTTTKAILIEKQGDTYRLVTRGEAPTTVEAPFEDAPHGAKGVGELPMDVGAPAVVAAIHDAVGAWVHDLPATPERILAALGVVDSVGPPGVSTISKPMDAALTSRPPSSRQ